MPAPAITTVIPAFNEGDRLFTFLQDWASVGTAHTALRVTALVVDDGSQDGEAARQRQAVDAAAAPYEEDHVYRFMLEAYRLKMTFNSGIFARVPLARVQQACGDLYREVDAGRLDPETLYVVSLPSLPRFKELGAACGRFDGDWICVSKDSDEVFRAYLETGKIIDRK